MSATPAVDSLLWPTYLAPDDLATVEQVPLAQRGVPGTSYDVLCRIAAARPDDTAFTVLPDVERWQQPVSRTYGQLLCDVRALANGLHDLGVRRDTPVLLLSPNCDDLITALLAAQLAGIASPVNGSLSPEHVTRLLALSGARVAVTAGPDLDPAVWSTVETLAADGLLDTVVVVRPTGTPSVVDGLVLPGARVVPVTELLEHPVTDAFVGTPPVAADLAALFHTGGTTGAPKLAAHTHANEVSDAWMVAADSTLGRDDRVFAALPLFHVNALVVTLLAPLLRGQPVLWAGPLGYREPVLYALFWQLVEHYRIVAMSAVPTVYAVLAACPVDADISSLRYAVVGASALPPAVRAAFEGHTGVTLVEGYGLTEATCASVRGFTDGPRAGSVGQRMPYQQLKAVTVGPDGSWTDLPPGETGVVVLSGPTVFPGYVVARHGRELEVDSLGTVKDGWLNMGDVGFVDPDGFLHLRGRAKDVIIRGGHNIDPSVVEDALLEHPGVSEAAAVGEPDPHSGEVPVAFVTLAPGHEVATGELVAWAAEHVSERAAAPRSVTVVDALPMTDIGKPYKLGLRAQAAEHAVGAALSEVAGVHRVEASLVDGVVEVSVVVSDRACLDDVGAALAPYALVWHVVVEP